MNIYPIGGKYDCLQCCVIAPNTVVTPCTESSTAFIFDNVEIPSDEGYEFSIAGQSISLINNGGTEYDGYTLIEPWPTAHDRALSFIQSFQANAYLANNYHIELMYSDPLIAIVLVDAFECGSQWDLNAVFNFNPTNLVSNPATNLDWPDGHGFLISVFDDGQFLNDFFFPSKLNDNIPEACFDLAKYLKCYLSFTKPQKLDFFSNPYTAKPFQIRASEVYENNGIPTPYGNQDAGTYFVLNAAMQRINKVDMTVYCDEFPDQKFLTNAPRYQKICCDTCIWVSAFLMEGATVVPTFNLTYADGSTSIMNGSAYAIDQSGVYSFAVGPGNGFLTGDIRYIEFYLEIDGSNMTHYITEKFYFEVDKLCKCSTQLFFQNMFGVTDTILFDCTTAETIKLSNIQTCEYVNCGDAVADGGKQISVMKSEENFVAISRNHYSYDDKEWVKEFYRSRWKGSVYMDEMVTVIPLSGSAPIAKINGALNLYSVFNFRYSFDGSTQTQ